MTILPKTIQRIQYFFLIAILSMVGLTVVHAQVPTGASKGGSR